MSYAEICVVFVAVSPRMRRNTRLFQVIHSSKDVSCLRVASSALCVTGLPGQAAGRPAVTNYGCDEPLALARHNRLATWPRAGGVGGCVGSISRTGS